MAPSAAHMHPQASIAAPLATIGVFGSGQLGRMLGLSATAMGCALHCFSPDGADSPTAQVAARAVTASYSDLAALRSFVAQVDVLTFEFENVPVSVVEVAEEAGVPVRPGGHVLQTAQNRAAEERFLALHQLPVTPHVVVKSLVALHGAVEQLGLPVVLKSAAWGYDGKGQVRIDSADLAEPAWRAIGQGSAIAERYVDFECELSVVAVRGADGDFANYGVIENHHYNHILALSLAPARIPLAVAARAVELTERVMASLDVVGVLCVEFFRTKGGELLINELAPRPHNSGHLTIDAAINSQFDQQVRAVCGWPLGCTDLLQPAVMVNLMGDLWQTGAPNWSRLLGLPGLKLHLYGKRTPRNGRKMGHFTVLAESLEQALEVANRGRRLLGLPKEV